MTSIIKYLFRWWVFGLDKAIEMRQRDEIIEELKNGKK